MTDRIAAVGSTDSVSYFGILGCSIFEAEDGVLSKDQKSRLKNEGYEIIFITEEVLKANSDFFKGENGISGPSVTLIPDLRGAKWKEKNPVPSGMAMKNIRRAVIRAIGQDISESAEGRNE